jgi:hypothetical protein
LVRRLKGNTLYYIGHDFGTGPDFATLLQLSLAERECNALYERVRARLEAEGKIAKRPLFVLTSTPLSQPDYYQRWQRAMKGAK